jgi:hypothetical protein
MGGSSSRTIRCAANQWTNVLWYGGLFWSKSWTVDVGGNSVSYRRYGAGVPPYWSGSFAGSKKFTAYPWDVYIRVDVKPSREITVTVTA